MTIQTIPGGLWIPPAFISSSTIPVLTGTSSMTTANWRVAAIFRVPKTGTLDWFEWGQQLNGNTPDNGVRFSFQDVNSSGNPDNTEDQFRTITSGFANGAWLVPPGVMTNDGTNGGSKRSVTRGDLLACVVRFENFVASDSIAMMLSSFSIIAATGSIDPLLRYYLESTDAGSSWSKFGNWGPTMALKYSDGTYGVLTWPVNPGKVINTRTFNNGSTPDERGLIFQIPFPARISGAWVKIDLDAAADIVLYDNASSVLASKSLVSGQRAFTTPDNARIDFDTPVNLSANTNYRLSIKPTSASSVSIADFDINASALLSAMDGGSTWMSTSRTDAGAWTDTNTNRPYMGIILDGFDDGASTGGGEKSFVF